MAVYKREGEKYWRVRFQWKGESVNRRTYATTRHAAHQIEAGLRAMISRGESLAPAVTFPLSEEMCRKP
jgi:hypothetical protein